MNAIGEQVGGACNGDGMQVASKAGPRRTLRISKLLLKPRDITELRRMPTQLKNISKGSILAKEAYQYQGHIVEREVLHEANGFQANFACLILQRLTSNN